MENAAEETFRNQDTEKLRRYAAKARKRSEENTRRFFTAFFRFALPAVRSHRPPVRAEKPWRPLPVPSEDHSQQVATTALSGCEGRWERDGNHQKKAMKTNKHNTKSAPGLRDQSSNHQQTPTPVSTPAAAPAPEATPTPAQTPERPPLPRIDYARRQSNRELSTDQLLALLRTEAPRFYELAEVVGKRVWIQPEKLR